ncbi:MAG: CBS domain-containing protein [Gammaproteobacteria bacterium]|jgi:magnesium and cobalt transporter|nr:CBS domain-containing protein [Gammaproteobacteria bacterium]
MSESSQGAAKKTLLDRVSSWFSDEPADRSELMEMLRDAADRQIMDAEALNIIFGALQVSDMQARDIMIPRTQLVFLKAGDAPEVLLPTIIDSQHSRYPVIGDDLDDIKGILHAKDLLPLALSKNLDHFDIKDCIRPAAVVPESKRLNVLLQEFRNTRNHMAVVVDEYGHVSGVVTIEDVLEQIVGEIEDEHDVDEEGFIKQLDSHTFNVKATTAVDDFNEYFDVSLDEEEFDTVGGLVLKAFGHLPDRGEVVEIDDLRFKVLNADSRRLRLLQVKRPPDS